MNQRCGCHDVKRIVVILLALAAIGLAGCESGVMSGQAYGFDPNGLPNKKYFVGGGFKIEWVAPQAGIAYLAEETTGKILETKSLKSEEKYEFDLPLDDSDQVKSIFGIEMSELKFSMFFVPTKCTLENTPPAE